MKNLFAALLTMALVTMTLATVACSPVQDTQISGIDVVSSSIKAGAGNLVQMRGRSVALSGEAVAVGDKFPQISLIDTEGREVSLGDEDGKVKLISIVPAVMTKVCEAQTHNLSEQSQEIEGRVELYTISVDPVEILNKFSAEADIKNVTFLSDNKMGAFGENTGLLLSTDSFKMLARAIIVVDGSNTIRYMQVMENLGYMPDMAMARKAAAALL